jgi:hypothetical protein
MARLRRMLGCVVVNVHARRATRLLQHVARAGTEALRQFVSTHTWDCREALRQNVRGAVVTVQENIRTDRDLVVALSLMRTFSHDVVSNRKAYGLAVRVYVEYVPPAALPAKPAGAPPGDEPERRRREARARLQADREADVAAYDEALCRRAADLSLADEELVEPRVGASVQTVRELFEQVQLRRGRRKGALRVKLLMCRLAYLTEKGVA